MIDIKKINLGFLIFMTYQPLLHHRQNDPGCSMLDNWLIIILFYPVSSIRYPASLLNCRKKLLNG